MTSVSIKKKPCPNKEFSPGGGGYFMSKTPACSGTYYNTGSLRHTDI